MLKVTYLVWDKAFQVKIENLTDSALYIHLTLSCFSKNGNPIPYLAYVKDISTNYIPPKSYYILPNIQSNLEIDSLNTDASESIYDMLNTSISKQKEFIESTSPVVFRNILAFTTNIDLNNIITLDNKFWVNKISLYNNKFNINQLNKNNCTYRFHGTVLSSLRTGNQTSDTSNANKNNSLPDSLKGIVFYVQVGASHRKMSYEELHSRYLGILAVSEILHDGYYKYLIGNYRKYSEARYLKFNCGVKDAWVVVTRNGVRINIKEILSLL